MRVLAPALALLLLAPLALALPLPAPPRAAATWTIVVGPPSLPFQTLGYTPEVVQAAPGDTIVFTFRGGHSTTTGIDVATEPYESQLPAALHLNAWDSAVLHAGDTFSVTLTDPGVYLYYCKVGNHRNAGMRALVVVGAA